MEDLKHKWEQIDEDDYVAKYRDMRLRVEKMEEQQWWWAVYRGKEELCPEKPFARKKDYAMKMAEECAEENIEPYVSDDFISKLTFDTSVADKYSQLENSAFLHIRGTDYKNHWLHDVGLNNYYKRAIAVFPKNTHFYILVLKLIE
jgi:hypothetical protein